MWYVITMLIGLLLGAGCMFLCVLAWVEKTRKQAEEAERRIRGAKETLEAAAVQGREAEQRMRDASRLYVEAQSQHELARKQVISYKELQDENSLLKRDLQNLDVNLRKLELDGEDRDERQAAVATRSAELAGR